MCLGQPRLLSQCIVRGHSRWSATIFTLFMEFGNSGFLLLLSAIVPSHWFFVQHALLLLKRRDVGRNIKQYNLSLVSDQCLTPNDYFLGIPEVKLYRFQPTSHKEHNQHYHIVLLKLLCVFSLKVLLSFCPFCLLWQLPQEPMQQKSPREPHLLANGLVKGVARHHVPIVTQTQCADAHRVELTICPAVVFAPL